MKINNNYFRCYLIGGLGNQIFQNVLLSWIKKNHNDKIIISIADYLDYKNRIRNFRKIQSLYYEEWINKGHEISQNLMFGLRLKYRISQISSFQFKQITDKNFNDFDARNKEKFFKEILTGLEMKAHCVAPHLIKYREFNSSWIDVLNKYKYEETKYIKSDFENNYDITIHLRRGDYLNFPKLYYELKKTYFLNAIDLLKDKLKIYGKPKCLIIGNDIKWAKENLSDSINASYQFKDVFQDFRQILCSKNLIISNSSFSLSAAMLGMFNKSCKNIVAPLKYYVSKFDEGALAHDSWDLVDN
tara:strand:+ start:3730 stop:4632 length:903 start_codon:yes stop_codon:yes gene_type:complete